jgi:hypothetical protein
MNPVLSRFHSGFVAAKGVLRQKGAKAPTFCRTLPYPEQVLSRFLSRFCRTAPPC